MITGYKGNIKIAASNRKNFQLKTGFIYSTLLLLSAIALIMIASVSIASAQTTQTESPLEEVAKASPAATVTNEAGANIPVVTLTMQKI